MYLDIDEVHCIRSGLSVTLIHNTGCQFKISECKLLKGSSFENIPKLFYASRIINIITNKDKMFLILLHSKMLKSCKKTFRKS